MKPVAMAWKAILAFCIVALIISSPVFSALAQSSDQGSVLLLDGTVDPAVAQVGDEVKVKLTLLKGDPLCQDVVIRRPLDIVLLLDVSPSMDEDLGGAYSGTKLEGAIVAASSFLDVLDQTNDRVSIVEYSSAAAIQAGLGTPATTKSLVNGIPSNLTRSGTNIEAGLTYALDILNNGLRPSASSVIILLTDGNETIGNARSIAEQIVQKKIRLVTIGLGPSIDETLLREIASQPADFYYAPDTGDLEGIYQSVAVSIEEADPATQIQVKYTFDASNFELVNDSIYPPAQVDVNTITWSFPRLESDRQEMEVLLMANVPGKYNVALNMELNYLRCGQTPTSETPLVTYNVEVVETSPVSNIACGEIPVESDGITGKLCRTPWGWLLGIPLGLLLFTLWLLQNKDEFKRWVNCAQPIRACAWAKLPLYIWLAVLTGVLANMIASYACTTRDGLIFWRVTSDRQSAIYLKPVDPPLNSTALTPLENEGNCIGCHDTNNQAQTLFAITEGTNGRLIQLDYQGQFKQMPDLQGAYPAISPNGKYMAYAANNEDIYIYNLLDNTSQPLSGASEPGIIETMPAWSADGGRIAFVRAAGSNQSSTITVPCDIMVVSAQGGVPLLVPGASALGYNYHPAFSPDGKWLAFTHHETGTTTYGDQKAEIFIVPAQGGAARRIQANDGPGGQRLENAGNTWPSWSQDSKTLYFSSRRCDNQYDIFSTQIDETGNSAPATRLTLISDPQAFEYHVQEIAFLPDGLEAWLWRFLPWLLPLVALLLLNWWLCRSPKKRTAGPNVQVRVLDAEPPKGWVRPDQHFIVTIEMIGHPNCDKRTLQRPVDIVLLLDTSASMKEKMGAVNSRMSAAQKAAIRFVRCAINPRERIGVVCFADKAYVEQGLTDRENDIVRAIKRLEPSGSTAMKDGIERSVEILQQQGRKDTAKIIVLLSDGEPTDTESEVIYSAQSARDQGIRILTVGTGDANKELLQKLVADPGDYRYVNDARGLSEVYIQAALRLITPIAATELVFDHAFDDENFVLVPGTVNPDAKVNPGTLVWEIGEVDEKPLYFSYKVRPKKAGKYNVVTGGTIRYKECGVGPKVSIPVEPGAFVEVAEIDVPDDLPLRELKPPVKLIPPEPAWQPDKALFIGIGGTGRWVLTYLLSNLLNAGNGQIPLDENGMPSIRFLLFDTNEHENIREVSFAGVRISPEDTFILDENLISVFQQPQSLGAEFSGWINPDQYTNLNEQLNLANGTFGRRQLARIALLRNLNSADKVNSNWRSERVRQNKSANLEEWIRQRCAGILRKGQTTRIRVFIIGSLAGGLSGISTDIAALTRKIGSELAGEVGGVRIEGYFIDGASYSKLPGSTTAGIQRQANSFATLRELARYQLNPGIEYPIGWLNHKVSHPLYDDLLIFSQDYNPSVVSEAGNTNIEQVAWKILKNYIYPSLADILSVRLDKATGVMGPQDWFTQMQANRARRQNSEHRLVAGSAGIFSIRLPVQDILRSLQIRWAYELLRMFLTGRAEQAYHITGKDFDIPIEFDYSSQSIGSDIYNQDPRQMVKRWLLGGQFGGDGSPATQALLDYLNEDDSPLAGSQALRDDLDRDEKYLYQEQFRRLGQAVQVILVGNAQGARTSRLAYAQLFLTAIEERLLPLAKNLRELNQPELARFAEICVTAAQRQKVCLGDLCELITQNISGKPDGIWERISRMAKNVQELETELDQIACRRYLWGVLDQIPGETPHVTRFAEKWWAELFAGKVADYLDCITWIVRVDGHIDLQVRIEGNPYQLLEDGPEAILQGLVEIGSSLCSNTWQTLNFPRILDSNRLLTNDIGAKVGLLSMPICAQSVNDSMITPDTLIYIRPDATQTLLQQAKPFSDALSQAAVGQLAVNEAFYPSTEPMWLAFLHLRNGSIVEAWNSFTQSRTAYDRDDNFSPNQARFQGSASPKAVFKGEATARALEVSEDFAYSSAGCLHPYIAAALEYPDRAELFCLALAEGLIHLDQLGKVKLHPPQFQEILLSKGDQERIDPYVDALLNWCYQRDVNIQWNELTTSLKDRYISRQYSTDSMAAWYQSPPSDFKQGIADKKSLGYLVNALIRYFSRTGQLKWNNP